MGRTVLMKAAATGNLDVVRQFINARADLFEEDHKGRTALDWARVSNNANTNKAAKVSVPWVLRVPSLVRPVHPPPPAFLIPLDIISY